MSRPGPGILALLLLVPRLLTAGEVEIVFADLKRSGDAWLPAITLRHADSGWDHYADAWRVVTVDGAVLSHRTLYHPHVQEQPFTRSGDRFTLPPGTTRFAIEAHDSVHGWTGERLEIDTAQPTGPRWRLLDDR